MHSIKENFKNFLEQENHCLQATTFDIPKFSMTITLTKSDEDGDDEKIPTKADNL